MYKQQPTTWTYNAHDLNRLLTHSRDRADRMVEAWEEIAVAEERAATVFELMAKHLRDSARYQFAARHARVQASRAREYAHKGARLRAALAS